MGLRDVIGQHKAIRILLGTLRRERVPSSLLFTGDSGIGKKLTALNYAKALNCLDPVDHDACNRCISCRKIDGAIHPDVHVFVPDDDEIKIEMIRRAEEILSLTPLEGRRKVLIIDNAECMNTNAANAFLKTLEEPDEHSIIILVTSNAEGMLDTIRSRCMRVPFIPLSQEDFMKVLAGQGAPQDAAACAGLAMGRPGMEITQDLASERKWFLQGLAAMMRGETRCPWQDKAEIRRWLDLCLVFLRDAAVSSIDRQRPALLFTGVQRPVSPEPMVDAYRRILAVRTSIELNLNKSITWNYVSGIIQDTGILPKG
jgi:DNA polymerase-3 subunit delta'